MFNIQIDTQLIAPRSMKLLISSFSWQCQKKIDQMYSEVILSLYHQKNLYLRRSQNNAYNHDGLVDSDAVSLSHSLDKKKLFSFSLFPSSFVYGATVRQAGRKMCIFLFPLFVIWCLCYYFIIIPLFRTHKRTHKLRSRLFDDGDKVLITQTFNWHS